MKRHKRLYDDLCAFENLLQAAEKAQRGKRFTPAVAQFNHSLETELLQLQEELQTQTYRPGPYRTFTINDPKTRLVSAAPYRDRVVHHALCNIIEPIYERVFIYDSYACRKGKGTHAAVDRLTRFQQSNACASIPKSSLSHPSRMGWTSWATTSTRRIGDCGERAGSGSRGG